MWNDLDARQRARAQWPRWAGSTGALALALLAGLPLTGRANNCEAVQADIDGRLQAKGLTGYRLFHVETAASAPGRVVGQCDKGTRKIVYALTSGGGPVAAKGPAAPVNDGIPTECKDGSIVIGPDCSAGKRRAAPSTANR